jgi:hypothetical protein
VNGVVNPDGTKKPGVPLSAGEIAENDNCNPGYIDTVMKWMDSLDNGIGESYLAWTWDTWNDCSSSSGGYSLTTNYAGSYAGSPNIGVPTCTYGWGYWYHLAVRAGTNPPATCP